ncbi:hypothetical protein FB566_3545 [Stackebrandtia endophytica]|uniref:Uncharacterized protein n=1 Tax=Stackebrandtia endophytica TaxID=1496996 RepID=A0A543AZP2_9ACTN|nr:hypothetical protein [Stackebrandtia endophytica]TQL77970.1 hypothetical protein FB566_3545 [Stackebrandtia endophytica]
MTILRDRLDSLKVNVTSPDGQIKARLVGGDDLKIAFRPGAYKQYGERELEHQLERLAVLAWVGYRRGYFQAMSESSGESISEVQKPHWNAKRRRYTEAVAEMVAQGESQSGVIQAKSKGYAFWKVRIEDGTVDRMDEQQFLSEALSTFQQVRIDGERLRTLLKDEHFGLNIPPEVRRRVAARQEEQ